MRIAAPLRSLGRALRGERGASTVEFVIVFPVFMLIFLSAFEAAMLLTRQTMLERALDLVARDMRLTTSQTWTEEAIAARICRNARILGDCRERLVLELTPIDRTTYAMPSAAQPCVDTLNDVTPSTTWIQGGADDFVLLRACYATDLIFPGAGLGMILVQSTDEDGDGTPDSDTLRMTAASAFVLEP